MSFKVFITFLLLSQSKLVNTDLEKCNRIDKIVDLNADFILTALVPVLSSAPSRFRSIGLLFSEAMQYSIAKVNSDILGEGIKLGYEIYDSCGEEKLPITTEIITNVTLSYRGGKITEKLYDNISCVCGVVHQSSYHLGILGAYASSNSLHVSRLLLNEPLPVLSYISTSTELSKTEFYPNFFRTIPPDNIFVKALVDIIIHYDWSFVSLFSSDNTFGFDGRLELVEQLELHKICIDLDELFSVPYDETELRNMVIKLKKSNKFLTQPLVIIFSVEEAGQLILNNAAEIGLYNVTWILVDATGLSQWYSTISPKVISELFTIAHYSGEFLEFEQHFFQLSLTNNNNNQWVTEFLNINNGSQMSEFKSMFTTSMQYVSFIRNGVYAYAVSLKQYSLENDICIPKFKKPCKLSSMFNKTLFLEKYFRTVSFQGLDKETFKFNKFGDVDSANLLVYKVHNKNNQLQLGKIGVWNSKSGLNISNDWTFKHRNISSCSKDCLPGYYPTASVGKQCCWICVQCEVGYVKHQPGNHLCQKCPDFYTNENHTHCVYFHLINILDYPFHITLIYILTSVGFTLSLIVIYSLCRFQKTPVVKSSNFKLSLVQVTAQMSLFMVSLLFTMELTLGVCMVRIILIGAHIVLIITIMLVKSEQLLHVFKSKVKITEHQIYRFQAVGVAVVMSTGIIEVLLSCILLLTIKIELVMDFNMRDKTKELKCTFSAYILMQSIYVVFLALACGIQAFRSRRLPRMYNEARFILSAVISMVCFVGLLPLLRLNAETEFVKSFMVFVVVFGANLAVLLVMYGYKLQVIWFQPEKNKLELYKKSLFQNVQKVARKEPKLSVAYNKVFSVELNTENRKTTV